MDMVPTMFNKSNDRIMSNKNYQTTPIQYIL